MTACFPEHTTTHFAVVTGDLPFSFADSKAYAYSARKMAGGAISAWWTRMSPYYAKAYQEMWVGLGIMTYFYYKISYGGKKAVKGKPAH
ncbi:hypothetical protein COCON_G00095010 [Conger conger]|uniref:Uncharacterized protein n=1 Tax=Conger conger TaxID=82655 RepID=A0A9Q1DMR0_CONCO|nr:ATP synthase subunit ATP5MPL, mitochondrial [Conger conger]KAJ8274876.1 hypothetical protein COCON_G00095010 [Conger conger]